ncbi:AarF/UbiB family protein [Candidatus Bandiella euplotis]|uniref:AarF/UbiB family protein n=1 Tax=Candidatus Bandiella euplotis TaxID=1664265 RepID=UPI002B261149|nr:AarF/UbiB family protein [Candidatus Bandiella woodruffii]
MVIILPKLGPAFIKLGQILSTRGDLLGADIANSMLSLQDKLPSFAIQTVEKIFKSEFGANIEDMFLSFDQESVAAASIAQVHKAITKDGVPVAVKILRPKISKAYMDNLRVIKTFSHLVNLFVKKKKRIKINEALETLKKSSEIELDLRLEGAAAEKIKENCKRDMNLHIPKIYWQLTSKNILTSEWIDGIPINQRDKLIGANLDLNLIIEKLAVIFFNQACRDGFFHADIHPGNIIIKQNGDIAMVDFGIVCYLDYELKTFVAEVVYGFLNKDYTKIKEIHFQTGFVPKGQSEYKFELACISIGEPIVGKSLEEISLSKLLKHLFEISRDFSVTIHPELLLLHKTILTIEGTGHYLNPKINMWNLASPWIQSWAKKNLGARWKLAKLNYQKNQFINKIKHVIDNSITGSGMQKQHSPFKHHVLVIVAGLFLLIGLILGRILSSS